jgi:DNA-binding NtrC family response regulator
MDERTNASLSVRVGMSIAEAERRLILATLEGCGGDKKQAAETLKISLKTLYNRLNEYKAV